MALEVGEEGGTAIGVELGEGDAEAIATRN